MKSPDPVPTVDKCGEEKLDIATQRCTEVYICYNSTILTWDKQSATVLGGGGLPRGTIGGFECNNTHTFRVIKHLTSSRNSFTFAVFKSPS